MILLSYSQEFVAPLQFQPIARTALKSSAPKAKISSLSLPFFEDFNQKSAFPDASKWLDRQVYINNTMAKNPISIGVATFDALSQYGMPYDSLDPHSIRYADSLSSQIIDLSSYNPNDSLYLSFWYQAAGLGFMPERSDSLMLFFKSNKSTNPWQKIWSTSDTTALDFKQVILSITDTQYLHSNFQFRFINKASIGTNDDVWNLDYILLDAHRNRNDTLLNDMAFGAQPNSFLKEYSAMPYRQYLAGGAQVEDSLYVSIKNNFNSSQTISTLQLNAVHQNTSTSIGSATKSSININDLETKTVKLENYKASPSSSDPYEKVIFENKFYFNALSGDSRQTNDTLSVTQVFDNYLAYDDGSAEMSYFLNLFPTLPGKIALEFELAQADTLRGLAIYFGRQVPTASNKYFSIEVYKDIAYGGSSSDHLLYQLDGLQPKYYDTVNHFWIYKFNTPIALEAGTFYIGTTQAALSGSDSLYFGLDRNRIKSNHLYYNVLDVWTPSLIQGAIMLRPLLGQDIVGTNINEVATVMNQELCLWPNPATEVLNIKLLNTKPSAQILDYRIYNLLGQCVQKGNLQNTIQKIQLNSLPSGTYFLHTTSQNKKQMITKFTIQ